MLKVVDGIEMMLDINKIKKQKKTKNIYLKCFKWVKSEVNYCEVCSEERVNNVVKFEWS